MIELDHVSKAFRLPNGQEAAILRDITFSIGAGEFVGLAGRNGSGKSTLVRLLNGLLQPTSGKVRIDGIEVSDAARLVEIRRRVGMVFQHPDNQIVSSIVEEDVAFGPENLGLPAEEVRRRVDWALSVTGMEQHRDKDPNRLSGGQKQRVAIAGALAMRPSHLVLDEPTSMLDPWGRRELMDTLHAINRQLGMTIIMISHHAEELLRTDRLIIMDQGTVERDGEPFTLLEEGSRLGEWGIEMPDLVYLQRELKARTGIGNGSSASTVEEMVDWLCRSLS